MNCFLCEVSEYLKTKPKTELWIKEIEGIKLKGEKCEYDKQELIIRHLDDNIIGINGKPYAKDVVVMFPTKHVNNTELHKTTLCMEFYQTIDNFIQKNYQGNARTLTNYGTLYASVPDHAHVQITYNVDKDGNQALFMPPKIGNWNYKENPLEMLSAKELADAIQKITHKNA